MITAKGRVMLLLLFVLVSTAIGSASGGLLGGIAGGVAGAVIGPLLYDAWLLYDMWLFRPPMVKEQIATPKGQAIGPYSHGMAAGNLVFVSGQIALDAATGKLVDGDVGAQARQALENARAILDAAGLGFAHVIKTTIFLTDMADFAAVNEVYKGYVAEPYPARSTIAVAALPLAAKVEIEMIASRGAV
jgi:2-iminobutanoate/2-iminopropanoate deaminase